MLYCCTWISWDAFDRSLPAHRPPPCLDNSYIARSPPAFGPSQPFGVYERAKQNSPSLPPPLWGQSASLSFPPFFVPPLYDSSAAVSCYEYRVWCYCIPYTLHLFRRRFTTLSQSNKQKPPLCQKTSGPQVE